MQSRMALVVLTMALCVTTALGAVDVAVEIRSPHGTEPQGLVPMQVKLSNKGDSAALVPLLTAIARPSGYWDYRENISIAAGDSTTVTLNPWVYLGGTETCMVWIAYPDDDSSLNDWDAVIVNTAGTSGRMGGEWIDRGQVGFVPTLDVAAELVCPRDSEEPGLIPVMVRVTNVGTTAALVPRIDVNVRPSGYRNYIENVAVDVGDSQVVVLASWVYTSSAETCFTWITYDGDENAVNDADVVMVSSSGVAGSEKMQLQTGTSVTLTPSVLTGSRLSLQYTLNRAGPATVRLLDVSGRVAYASQFNGGRIGELPLDLRSLSGGVYLVRLDDGRSAITRKLVVQR